MIADKSTNLSHPTVSVVMNCFNSERYLQEALESVVAQEFVDWELVFWDNQSTDRSAEIFKEFGDCRFKYFYAPEHKSLGEARNLAVAVTTGQWLAFIDCDDCWHPDKLKLQIEAASKGSSGIGLVYGLFSVRIDGSNSTLVTSAAAYYNSLRVVPHGSKNIYHELLMENFIVFSSVLILRQLFIEVGGIDPRLKQLEDYDLLIKASIRTNAVCIDKICVNYRVHLANNSHVQSDLSFGEFDIIYNALHQTKEVRLAKKINYSRRSIEMIFQGKIWRGLWLGFRSGSVLWVISRAYTRFVRRLSRCFQM